MAAVLILKKIDFSKSHNRRDFGKGFYTTILRAQSKEWAYRLIFTRKEERINLMFM